MDEKRLFGEIAIERGFVSVAQVKQALEIQREMRKSGEGHKLIGVLLVDLGFMTPEQIVQVMELYDVERARDAAGRERPKDDTGSDPLLRGIGG